MRKAISQRGIGDQKLSSQKRECWPCQDTMGPQRSGRVLLPQCLHLETGFFFFLIKTNLPQRVLQNMNKNLTGLSHQTSSDWLQKQQFLEFSTVGVQKTLIGKDPDARKDWGQEDNGAIEDEMIGWHHRHNGLEFEQAPWDGEGQGSLVCCSPQGLKESDRTLQLNSNNKGMQGLRNHPEPCTHFTPEGHKAWTRPHFRKPYKLAREREQE